MLLVSEVLVKYLEFAEDYYDADGTPGKEFRAMIDAIAVGSKNSAELKSAENTGLTARQSLASQPLDFTSR